MVCIAVLNLCCSVVEVQGVENAKKAIDIMHKQELRGRNIIVREASLQFLLNRSVVLLNLFS